MSKLQEKFNSIIAKIEERIQDQEELKFIKEQIAEISMLYIDELNKVIDVSEKRVNQVYENQKILEKKMNEIENNMGHIQKELFVEEDYDFEIVCPYCNHEFVTDMGVELKEVECPECHNIIELDWNHEEDCHGGGHCSGCHECQQEDDKQQNNANNANQDYEEDYENTDEEDDM